MTAKQPEALRLAERMEGRYALHPEVQEVAAELRRQHAALEKYEKDDVRYLKRIAELEAQREELLQTLRNCFGATGHKETERRAVIAKAEGSNGW